MTSLLDRRQRTRLVAPSLLDVSLGAFLLTACGGGAATAPPPVVTMPPAVAQVTVTLAETTLRIGQSAMASAVAYDQGGAPITGVVPVWSIGATGIATVSAAGIVTALVDGETTIIATINGRRGERLLRVVPLPVQRVDVAPAEATIPRGATVQLATSLFDAGGGVLTGRVVSWSSSDTLLATVSATGVVTARAPGTAIISATSEGATASSTITIPDLVGAVATVIISPPSAVLRVGERMQLSAAIEDAEGNTLEGRPVRWAASIVTGAHGAAVATVSPAGLVTAISAGTVIVEGTSDGQRGAATIVVRDDIDPSIHLIFSSPERDAVVGDTLRIYVSVQSAHEITSVTAGVGPQELALQRTLVSGPGVTQVVWTRAMNLADLHFGPYQLVATARDVRGAIGIATITFQRDTRTADGGGKPPTRSK